MINNRSKIIIANEEYFYFNVIISSPALARKSRGFARILLAFLPENGNLKNSSGRGCCSPLARTPMLATHPCPKKVLKGCVLQI